MNRKILFLLLIPILALTAACAPSLEVAALSAADALPAELMVVQPDGEAGELITYDMATGLERFRLPAGFLTADESAYYAAAYQRGRTQLNLYDPQTGVVTQRFSVEGEWSLEGISGNGRWLLLIRVPGEQEQANRQNAGIWQTEVQVFDTEANQTAQTMILDGNYEIDAISNNGTALFLIQNLPPANPDHYLIRAYDLSINELLPDPLRDKRFFDELMVGYPWGSITDEKGVWHLTLYINTQRNVAFIHALNMVNRRTVCIDLPSGEGDFNTLQQYTLTLSPDRQKVYAANAALGVVAEVSFQNLEVAKQLQFPAHPLPLRGEEGLGLNASLITADGATLYFTDGRQVWSYDTATGTVSEPLLESDKDTIQGLALSDDGQQLYIARAERPLLIFSAAIQ